MRRKLFNEVQVGAIDEALIAIGDVASFLAALKAIGVDMPDREAVNASRSLSCERCQEVAAEYERQQQG